MGRMGPRRRGTSASRLLAALLVACATARAQLSCPLNGSNESNDTTAMPLLAGGTPAEPCRYPYMASLNNPAYAGLHICGGTLVNESWILTAASCVDIKFSTRNFANPVASLNGLQQGEPDTFQENIPTLEAELRVHPKYRGDPASGYNVALLKLESPSKQPPLKLAVAEEAPEPGENVGLIGWGRSGGTGPFAPTLLEATDVEIEDLEDCKAFGAEDTAKVFCAGSGDKAFCQGDEGGPVLRLGDDASGDVQVGVATSQVTDGIPSCGIFGRPTKFTGLEHLIDWINEVVSGS